MEEKKLILRYEPKELEKKWIHVWEENLLHLFPRLDDISLEDILEKKKKDHFFSMVIPPPNITGSLHLGHALNHTIQDLLLRYHRLKGNTSLWVTGTDHAGIATQNVVAKKLSEKGIDLNTLSREEFEKKIWEWKDFSGGTISKQQKKLGESVCWEQERFTLSKGFSSLVTKVFNRLYDDGLIYQAKRMVHWCPVNQTAISDIEVEHKEVKGSLYYIHYYLEDGDDSIIIATTRPETLLGDEAIAVSPDDVRYQKFIGKFVYVPLTNKKIPVIADSYVDSAFGTGAVKITPGHDMNDFEVGKRHALPLTVILDTKAHIIYPNTPYHALSREQARKQIVNDLENSNFLEKVEQHTYKVGYNSRSQAIIEPLPSTQWFLKVAPLAEKAIRVVDSGEVEFTPAQWKNTYFEWMRNIDDWCISRQIRWGHRIPIWYDLDSNQYTGTSEEDVRQKHSLDSSVILKQDEDVLDTWFSSALWPFATLWTEEELLSASGWPQKNKQQAAFYPNTILVTGFDIIFFWVARMIMLGCYCMGEIPFHKVYIHGLVRDVERKKMSKSKGNVVNPLEAMEQYGTDAFRFFLMSVMPSGKDIVYDERRLNGYMYFCNKIWNTARFIHMNVSNDEYKIPDSLDSAIDIWIILELYKVIPQLEHSIEECKFSMYANLLYNFIWKIFCDYYIEFSKVTRKKSVLEEQKKFTLSFVWVQIIKLLHPVMPFITEELFMYTKPWNITKEKFVFLESWPKRADLQIKLDQKKSLDKSKEIQIVIDILYAIRNIKGELEIPPSKRYFLYIEENEIFAKCLKEHKELLERLLSLDGVFFVDSSRLKSALFLKVVTPHLNLFLDLESTLLIELAKNKALKNLEEKEKYKHSLESKLNNIKYVQNAPPEIILQDRNRLKEIIFQIQQIQEFLKN